MEKYNFKIIALKRDLIRNLKQGHRWIFSDCFDQNEREEESGVALLRYRSEDLAIGVYQHDSHLRFRVLFLLDEFFVKKNNWEESFKRYFEYKFDLAVNLRINFLNKEQNCVRLINGEGDGLPGLIVDIYNDVAVIKHDHPIMDKIWKKDLIAQKIVNAFPFIKHVYLKRRNDDDVKGENIIGELPLDVTFKENGVNFSANIRDGAKTGFFLDQRDNRFLMSKFTKNKSVLNLFSYTGGFSIFSAIGGASAVTSVDIAKNAILACEKNFSINNLNTKRKSIDQDAFVFISEAIKNKELFDVVITDPPSFAPNSKSIETASEAYKKVFSDSLKLVNKNGLLALSSCSSHINQQMFNEICQEVFSKNRKKGTMVYQGGQGFDHPYPHAMEELRYLKFNLFRID